MANDNLKRPTREKGEILLEMGSIAPDLVNDILRKQRETGRLFGEIATGDGLVPPEDINRAIRVQKTQKDQSAMVKVSAARLNAFVDLAGELVIIQSMIREGLKAGDMAGVERTREQLESISTGLKELALAMGMVGVSDLYNRLRIVVRNTAKDLGRLVDFSVSGEETELDRKLVEALYDPLVHMVRNAIDHGIEAPAERSASHKNATGTLSISASPKSNGIEIVVEDDGRGIDPEVLVAKALARGFITEEKARACRQNPQDAYKLLYLPGFSTKDQVSGVSGRGVGMDVVKTNVESIGGRMEIWSKPGKGTRFSIRIPLSLAIIEGFVCTIRARKCVFPFASLEEILVWPPEGKQAEHVQTQGNGRIIIRYRNDFLPVTDARRVFRFGDDDPVPRQRPLLVLRQDEHLFGLLVDEAIGQQEIVIKSLDEIMDRLPCLSGGSIFGDGSIGFVVNMDELAETLVEQRSMPKGHE